MKADSGQQLKLLKGGRLGTNEFAALPMQAKIDYLHNLDGKTRLDTILNDPMPGKLVRALPKEDLYQVVHELGAEESVDLLHLASPAQIRFILDWELWEEWSISVEKTAFWLETLLADEDLAASILTRLDQELLLVFLKKTIEVGGGLGDIICSEDHQLEWDHTFDEIYFIRVVDSRHNQTVLRLIDLLYRLDTPLYRSLMQGVENELLSELEESAGQFRRSRLADEGFPSPSDAAILYTRVATHGFTPAMDKQHAGGEEEFAPLPAIAGERSSLLWRAFALADSAELRREFHYLTSGALVAEGVSPADRGAMQPVLERVANYLNIALEFLCSDEARGVEILSGEHLATLFRLGHSLLAELQDRARRLGSDNYAANRVLEGLKMRRPRFYRGLDQDLVDDYREFGSMEDLRTMDRFLRGLESA